MAYKVTGVITKFTSNGICIKAEQTCKVTEERTYNIFIDSEKEYSEDVKFISSNKPFTIDSALTCLISILAANSSKTVFVLDDALEKIVSVEIENNVK